jgi:hypothetical protein
MLHLTHQCCILLFSATEQLLKLMEQFPDLVFLKVNFDDNKAMCKTLGVKVRFVITVPCQQARGCFFDSAPCPCIS